MIRVDLLDVMQSDRYEANFERLRSSGQQNARAALAESKDAYNAACELLDFVRASPCHCSAALPPLPAIQCERCRLLARCGATP